MILTHKSFWNIVIWNILCFLCVMSGLVWSAGTAEAWLSSLFSDKLWMFLLVPLFLTGISKIESSLHVYTVTRMKDRRTFFLFRIGQQYLYALIYMAIWLVLTFAFGRVCFPSARIAGATIWDWFFRFLWGLIMLVNLTECVGLWSKSASSLVACTASYGFMLMETMVLIPETAKNLPVTLRLIFGWIFTADTLIWSIRLALTAYAVAVVLLSCTGLGPILLYFLPWARTVEWSILCMVISFGTAGIILWIARKEFVKREGIEQ